MLSTRKRQQIQRPTVHTVVPDDPFTIIQGDALSVLRNLPNEFFQTCVTSPPYWGLRDYGHDDQLGAERFVDDYIDALVMIFREVRSCLRNDGTLWLNIGDSYTSGNRTWRDSDDKNKGRAMSYRPPTPRGLKPKDLIGIPWRLAFALQADGWFLRSDVVWHKPNCQPESVKDRPTRAHEYVFLFSRSKKYLYQHDAIKERAANGELKNKRSVWTLEPRESVWNVNTEPYLGAHFAVFPQALIRPCILAGSERDDWVLDPFLGSGTTAVVANQLGRKCVGIELKSEYVKMARERAKQMNLILK